jgi:hypothetical protein
MSESSCSICKGGPCPAAQACHRPELPARIERRLFTRPTTREARGRLIGAALATGGFLLFVFGHFGHHLGWF